MSNRIESNLQQLIPMDVDNLPEQRKPAFRLNN